MNYLLKKKMKDNISKSFQQLLLFTYLIDLRYSLRAIKSQVYSRVGHRDRKFN